MIITLSEQEIELLLLNHGTVRYNDDGSVIVCLSKQELLEAQVAAKLHDMGVSRVIADLVLALRVAKALTKKYLNITKEEVLTQTLITELREVHYQSDRALLDYERSRECGKKIF